MGAFARIDDPRATIVLASTRERRPAWVPGGIETQILPWPRRPVQLAWCLGLGPELERGLGKLDVAQLIQPFPPVRTRAPQVAVVHDLFPIEHPEWYRPSERWAFRRSMNLVLQRAHRLIVPSAYVAGRLEALLGIDLAVTHVVHFGVTGVFARSQPAEDVANRCAKFGVQPNRFAVCLGAVSTRKNSAAVVRAMEFIDEEAMSLVLVGPDGHGVEEIEAEISRLDRRIRIIRTGFLNDDDTAALVQGAAMLVHPALSEGFGLVPLEAMAAGTPVVAAGVGSLPEVVGDAAILVSEPEEPGLWAEAIAAVMNDSARSDQLRSAGRQRVARFSWDAAAHAMLDVCALAAGA